MRRHTCHYMRSDWCLSKPEWTKPELKVHDLGARMLRGCFFLLGGQYHVNQSFNLFSTILCTLAIIGAEIELV